MNLSNNICSWRTAFICGSPTEKSEISFCSFANNEGVNDTNNNYGNQCLSFYSNSHLLHYSNVINNSQQSHLNGLILTGNNANLEVTNCCILDNFGNGKLFWVGSGSIKCDEYCYIETNGLGTHNAEISSSVVFPFVNHIYLFQTHECKGIQFFKFPLKYNRKATCAVLPHRTSLSLETFIIYLSYNQ